MTFNKFQITVLSIAGFTVLLVGCFLALDPHGFYAGYGVTLDHTDLLSEVRANGTNLAALGCLMLAGVVKPSLRAVSVTCSLVAYFAIASGRVLSLATDGLPSDGILMALGIELVIAALCLVAFASVLPRGDAAGSPA